MQSSPKLTRVQFICKSSIALIAETKYGKTLRLALKVFHNSQRKVIIHEQTLLQMLGQSLITWTTADLLSNLDRRE